MKNSNKNTKAAYCYCRHLVRLQRSSLGQRARGGKKQNTKTENDSLTHFKQPKTLSYILTKWIIKAITAHVLH